MSTEELYFNKNLNIIIDDTIIPDIYLEKLVNKNKPDKIIIVDSNVSDIDLITLNRVHKLNGLICFAYHYFIDKSGNIFQGRYETVYPAKATIVNNFMQNYTGILENNTETPLEDLDKEIQIDNNYLMRSIDFNHIETIDKIYVCLEGNTKLNDITNDQYKSCISLCKNIMERYRNIKNIYGLNELIPSSKNPGIFLSMNKIRSNALQQILPLYVDTPSGQFSYTFGSRDLYFNEDKPLSGNDISLYQMYLKIIGYSINQPTGIYDNKTYNITKLFQKSFDLKDDGIVTSIEYEIITKLIKDILNKKDQFEFARILEYNEDIKPQTGLDVEIIQKKLSEMSIYLGELDGKFTKEMKESVEEYQRLCNLPVSGKIGPITFDMILSGEIVKFNKDLIYNEDNIMTGNEIKFLQKKIKSNMRRFGLISVNVNGKYDKLTMQNVQKIQLSQLLIPTGIVNQNLYNFIKNL